MFEWLKFRHRSVLGIDISEAAVNAVEVAKAGENYSIVDYACEPLPRQAVVAHTIYDIDAIATSIQKLLSKTSFSTKLAVLAVPDAVVISKIVQLNASLTSREIEEAVFIEVGNDIAYRFDELCIDFTLLNSAIKNPEIMDVLIIATHTENIQKRTEISQRAGLEVKIIDIESYAIERMSLFFPKFSYQSQLLFNKSPSLLVACGLALRDIH